MPSQRRRSPITSENARRRSSLLIPAVAGQTARREAGPDPCACASFYAGRPLRAPADRPWPAPWHWPRPAWPVRASPACCNYPASCSAETAAPAMRQARLAPARSQGVYPPAGRRCCSSVVEHPLGKGEVDSSILSSSTSLLSSCGTPRTDKRALAPCPCDLELATTGPTCRGNAPPFGVLKAGPSRCLSTTIRNYGDVLRCKNFLV